MSKIVLTIHKILFLLNKIGIPLIPNFLNKIFIRILFGCQIGVRTYFGKNVELGYGGLGVVIHDRAVIGNNVSIGPGVTIGGTNKKYEVPKIGDNTIVSSGAKVIGSIVIGKNCVIGANAVVVTDLPDKSLAVGIPAKIIKKNIDISSYRSLD
jgi:serine O-acetyltransferase